MNDIIMISRKVDNIFVIIDKNDENDYMKYKSSKSADQKYKVIGILGEYGGGGKVWDANINDSELCYSKFGCINNATRALIIEWTLYNPSKSYFGYCRIVLLLCNLVI